MLHNLGVAEDLSGLVAGVVTVDSTRVLGGQVVQRADHAVAFRLVALAEHQNVVSTSEWVREKADGPVHIVSWKVVSVTCNEMTNLMITSLS